MQFGTWGIIPSVQVASVLAQKLDFIIIDREHGNASYEDVFAMCSVIQRENKGCYVRASSNNDTELLHLMDSGVDGIIIPHVSTVKDVEMFIEYTNFPSVGCRGYTPFVYNGRYGKWKNTPNEYKKFTNTSLMRGVIIEDEEGLQNLSNILKYPLDMIYIGIYDLASSLGVKIDDPLVKTVFSKIIKMAEVVSIPVGAIFNDSTTLNDLRFSGVEYAVYKTDTAIIMDALEEMLEW